MALRAHECWRARPVLVSNARHTGQYVIADFFNRSSDLEKEQARRYGGLPDAILRYRVLRPIKVRVCGANNTHARGFCRTGARAAGDCARARGAGGPCPCAKAWPIARRAGAGERAIFGRRLTILSGYANVRIDAGGTCGTEEGNGTTMARKNPTVKQTQRCGRCTGEMRLVAFTPRSFLGARDGTFTYECKGCGAREKVRG